MAVFNGEPFLYEAVESYFNQTQNNLEMIHEEVKIITQQERLKLIFVG
jgi:hypothetical protein